MTLTDKEKIELVLKMIEDNLEAETPTIWTVEDHAQYLKIYLIYTSIVTVVFQIETILLFYDPAQVFCISRS